jgi:hypothetical protein
MKIESTFKDMLKKKGIYDKVVKGLENRMSKSNKIKWITTKEETHNSSDLPLRFDFIIKPQGSGYVVIVNDPFAGINIENEPVGTLEKGKDWCEDYLEKYGDGNVLNS